jgi:biotin transport system substrate-specific component
MIIIFYNFYKINFISFYYLYFGVLWLGTLIGWDKPIIELGVMPFLLAEIFKIFTYNFSKKNF